ncbi:hypothetical protein ABZZ80_09380 [Streptomyces sp. NPDC006356]
MKYLPMPDGRRGAGRTASPGALHSRRAARPTHLEPSGNGHRPGAVTPTATDLAAPAAGGDQAAKRTIFRGTTRMITRVSSSFSAGGSMPRYLWESSNGSRLASSGRISAVPRISTEE